MTEHQTTTTVSLVVLECYSTVPVGFRQLQVLAFAFIVEELEVNIHHCSYSRNWISGSRSYQCFKHSYDQRIIDCLVAAGTVVFEELMKVDFKMIILLIIMTFIVISLAQDNHW